MSFVFWDIDLFESESRGFVLARCSLMFRFGLCNLGTRSEVVSSCVSSKVVQPTCLIVSDILFDDLVEEVSSGVLHCTDHFPLCINKKESL